MDNSIFHLLSRFLFLDLHFWSRKINAWILYFPLLSFLATKWYLLPYWFIIFSLYEFSFIQFL